MNSPFRTCCRGIVVLVTALALSFVPAAAHADVGTTELVKDIRPGGGEVPNSSNPSDFNAVAGGRVVFAANDSVSDRKLFVTDGTEAGTVVLLAEEPTMFVRFDANRVFFVADSKLHVTDGTPAGTVDLGSIGADMLHSPVVFDGRLYFPSDRGGTGMELWRTDGTVPGTVIVEDLNAGDSGISAEHIEFAIAGGELYFTANNGSALAGFQIYKTTDGTPGTTSRVTSLGEGVDGGGPYAVQFANDDADRITNLTAVGDDVFFVQHGALYGRELWVVDPLEFNKARLVKDISPRNNHAVGDVPLSTYAVSDLTAIGGKLYFWANDAGMGGPDTWQAWVSDGTEPGTVKLEEEECVGGTCRHGFTEYGGLTYFTVDGNLYRTDGTEIGTELYSGANAAHPEHLFVHGGKLFFSARHQDQALDTVHNEPVVTDGSGTVTMLADITADGETPAASQGPVRWFEFDGGAYFVHALGKKLYRTDGTPGGTSLVSSSVSVRDIEGSESNIPLLANDFAIAGGKLIFRGRADGTGDEVFIHDPATAVPSTPVPTFGAVTRTADGFTVPITNFDVGTTYIFTPSAGVSQSGGVITVTGLAANQPLTVTVTAVKPAHTMSSAVVEGQALAAPKPADPKPDPVRPAPTLGPVSARVPLKGAGLPAKFSATAENADYLSFDFTNDGTFDATIPVAQYPHTAVFHGTPGKKTVAVKALQKVEGQKDLVASSTQRTVLQRNRNRQFEKEQTGENNWGAFSMSVQDESVADLLAERMESPDWTVSRPAWQGGQLCGNMVVTFERVGQVEGWMCPMSAAEAANKYRNPDMLWAAIAGVQTVFVVDHVPPTNPAYPERVHTGDGVVRINGMTLQNMTSPNGNARSQIYVIPSAERIIAPTARLVMRVDDLVKRPNDDSMHEPVQFTPNFSYVDVRLGANNSIRLGGGTYGYASTLMTQDVQNGWGEGPWKHRTLLGMQTLPGDTVTTRFVRKGQGAEDKRSVEFIINKTTPPPMNGVEKFTASMDSSGTSDLDVDNLDFAVPDFFIGPFKVIDARFVSSPGGGPGCARNYIKGTGKIELAAIAVDMRPEPQTRGFAFCDGNFMSAGGGLTSAAGIDLVPGIVTLDRFTFDVQSSPYFLLSGGAGISVLRLVGLDGNMFFANPSPQAPMPILPQTVSNYFNSMWYIQAGEASPHLRQACYTQLSVATRSGDQSRINDWVNQCRSWNLVVATGPTFGIAGAVSFKPLGLTLANGHVVYSYPGYIDTGGSLNYQIAVLSLSGRARIQANTSNGLYNAEAVLRACLDFGVAEACIKLQAIVSSKGAAGCGEVLLAAVWFGYKWGDSWPDVGFGCRIGGYRVNVQGAAKRALAISKARAAGGDDSFTIAAGEQLVDIKIEGAGGAPSFTLTTPDGRKIHTKPSTISKSGNVQMMHWPKANRTLIGIKNGKPGRYTIKLDADSPQITKLAKGVAADATVTGKKVTKEMRLVKGKRVATGKQIVSWDASKLGTGLTYELWEQSGSLARSLGAVKAKGSKTFMPQAIANGEKRKLVLKVKRGGFVTGEVVLGTFKQPANPVPAKPAKVTATHKGTNVAITWKPVPGATMYTVNVKNKGGHRFMREVPARTRKVTIRNVAAWETGTVTVRAKNKLAQISKSGTASFKASGVRVSGLGTKQQARDDAKTRLANLAKKSSVKVTKSVRIGQQVAVTGSMFKPGEKVTITLTGGKGAGTKRFTVTMKASATGELVWKVKLRKASVGAWKVTAQGVTSKRTATAKFTVKR